MESGVGAVCLAMSSEPPAGPVEGSSSSVVKLKHPRLRKWVREVLSGAAVGIAQVKSAPLNNLF